LTAIKRAILRGGRLALKVRELATMKRVSKLRRVKSHPSS